VIQQTLTLPPIQEMSESNVLDDKSIHSIHINEIDMKILNLGCGAKTSDRPEVINIDYSIALRVRNTKMLRPLVPLLFQGKRLKNFRALPENILVHNLAKGIPFPDGSVDAVYHSHLFEHLDREVGEKFLHEVKRVLKPGGIHRIVVPDFEFLCRDYIAHIEACASSPAECSKHDSFVAPIIEQCVRREASGSSQQGGLRRFVENRLLGDARNRGETHQWMYDKINLTAKALEAGYKQVIAQTYDTSLISNWHAYGLDVYEDGQQYKPHSLYIEAMK
jgi:SAM-dependent methyltransferase